MSIEFSKPIIGFAAFSGTGKTTLLVKILPILRDKGLRVAMIKHAHHDFDVDKPGKDSYQLRQSGASPMIICSSRRTAIMIEHEQEQEPDLQDILSHIQPDKTDLVLVEGFKHWNYPKIELHRPSLGKPLLFPDDKNIIAIAHDGQLDKIPDIPQMDINKPHQIAEFVLQLTQQQ